MEEKRSSMMWLVVVLLAVPMLYVGSYFVLCRKYNEASVICQRTYACPKYVVISYYPIGYAEAAYRQKAVNLRWDGGDIDCNKHAWRARYGLPAP